MRKGTKLLVDLGFAAGVLAACPATGGADTAHDTVDALPELGTIAHGRARVIVRGELAKAQQRDALRIADEVIVDVERRFARPAKHADGAITLALLPGDARFIAVARAAFGEEPPSTWGFYRPAERIAIINFGQSVGNLRHELAHPLIADDFPDIPTWLNEGVASLYGTAKPTPHGFEFLVNYRLRDLQRAIKAGTLPTLRRLALSSEADVHGDTAPTYYAMARYVLLFVDRQGKLGALYGELRDASGDAKRQADILATYVDDAKFVAWAKRLRF
jgi:hypothetical protein